MEIKSEKGVTTWDYSKKEEPEITVKGDCPTLKIEHAIIKKMEYFARYFDKEIGGWIGGSYDPETREIILDDLMIPNQEVSTAEVDMDASGIIPMIKEVGIKRTSRILGHFHSHHSMGAFFSGTDETNMETIMEPDTRNLFVFIVTGEKGAKHKIRISITVGEFEIGFDGVDYEVVNEPELTEDPLLIECKTIWEEKVKETVPSYSKGNYTGWVGEVEDSLGVPTFSYNKKIKTMLITSKDGMVSKLIQHTLEAEGYGVGIREFKQSTQVEVEIKDKEEFKTLKDLLLLMIREENEKIENDALLEECELERIEYQNQEWNKKNYGGFLQRGGYNTQNLW